MAGTAKLQPKIEIPLDPGTMNAFLQALPLGLAIAEHGRIVYANPGFAQSFGIAQPLDVRGRAVQEFVPELKATNTLQDPPRPQASVADFQVNGRYLQIISAPAVAQKVPLEFNKLETLGRLVSGVAHDFNNLLTGIMLYCDLLLAGLKDDGMRHYAAEIRMAGDHGAALIQQLMAVARQETLQSELLSWNRAVLDMGSFLRRLVGENIDLVTDLTDDLGFVKIDPSRAHQIILNLVLNARDAMPQGGRITLSTSNCSSALLHLKGRENGRSPHMEFAVTDTGLGMDDQIRSQAFEPFFTTKPPGRGNGLGLATVYDLVQQVDGDIEIHSEPAKGTRIVIRLPCVEENTVPTAQLPPEVMKEGKSL
jgi:signal transduction histidine kinase